MRCRTPRALCFVLHIACFPSACYGLPLTKRRAQIAARNDSATEPIPSEPSIPERGRKQGAKEDAFVAPRFIAGAESFTHVRNSRASFSHIYELQRSHTSHIFAVIAGSLVVFILLACCLAQLLISPIIKHVVETIDQDIIGSDIRIESLWFDPFTGRTQITNLKVDNPKGYSSPYILCARNMLLHLDLPRLLLSCGSKIVIKELALRKIVVNVEKTMTTSNVRDMVHFFNYGTGQELLPPSGREYTLHTVNISQITFTTTFSTGSKIWDRRKKVGSSSTPIGDIVYPDFNQKYKIKRGLAKAILSGILMKVENKLNDRANDRGTCCGL